MTGSSLSGNHTSSRRLASPHSATSEIPSSSSALAAAATWGGPPSTTTKDGAYANFRGAPVVGSINRGPSSPSAPRSPPWTSDRRSSRRRRNRRGGDFLLAPPPFL